MDLSIWQYWYFHVPNYLLSLLLWTMIGRFVLGFFVPQDWDNYIWRAFRRLTDPVLRLFDWIIPAAIPSAFHPLAAAFHLYVLRVLLWAVLYTQGLLPSISGTAPPG